MEIALGVISVMGWGWVDFTVPEIAAIIHYAALVEDVCRRRINLQWVQAYCENDYHSLSHI